MSDNLLNHRVKPLAKNVSVEYASQLLHGNNRMHIHCDFNQDQITGMVNAAKRKLRRDYKTQEWYINGINSDGTYNLKNSLGYEMGNMSRSDFYLIK